ncbi:hypothetical protein PAHAL_6G201700 [Panicum hallii]|uniref:Uncharacterized protein n=1 Tax=Panicum hallii TaxID=206008 RepID=A0A2T8IGX5_9POAL|nr:hypothetical protein PAHAL_6G201700 [Panicum hallii]
MKQPDLHRRPFKMVRCLFRCWISTRGRGPAPFPAASCWCPSSPLPSPSACCARCPPLRSLRAPGDGGRGGWCLASLPAYATPVGPAAAAVFRPPRALICHLGRVRIRGPAPFPAACRCCPWSPLPAASGCSARRPRCGACASAGGWRPRQHVACVATGLPFLSVAFLAAPCSAMFSLEWFVMVLGLALPRRSSCSGRHGGSLVCPQWQRGTLLCLCSSRFVYGVLGLDRAGESVAPGARGGIPPLLGPPVPGARAFIGRCAAKASRSVRGGCAGRCFTFAHVTAPAEFLESPAASLFVLFLDLLDVGRWPLPWFGECSSSAPLLRRSSSCLWHHRIKCRVLYLSTSSVVPL